MWTKWKKKGARSFAATFVPLIFFALAANAENAKPGDFDYYVLSLSWTPSWCAEKGAARGAVQCAPKVDFGFTLHGLWPQHERGWPEYCATDAADPSRRQSREMADIMGDGGLAWHQWKKHGRCSGLSAVDYFNLSRRAYMSVARPPLLQKLDKTVTVDPKVVEHAFLEVNPNLSPDSVTVTCKGGRISEVRICLTKALEPRSCGIDAHTDCSYPAELSPIGRVEDR